MHMQNFIAGALENSGQHQGRNTLTMQSADNRHGACGAKPNHLSCENHHWFQQKCNQLSLCQLLHNLFPSNPLVRHENHQMIEIIADLIFDLIGIRILGGNHNFRGFLSQLL